MLREANGEIWNGITPLHLTNKRQKLPPAMFAHAAKMFLVRDFHTLEEGNVYKCLPISYQSPITKLKTTFLNWERSIDSKYGCTINAETCWYARECRFEDFRDRMLQFCHRSQFPGLKKGWRERPSPRVMGNNGRGWRFRKRIGMWESGGVTMQVSVQAGSGCLLCQVYPQAWALEAQFLVHIPGCIS